MQDPHRAFLRAGVDARRFASARMEFERLALPYDKKEADKMTERLTEEKQRTREELIVHLGGVLERNRYA
jgi:hypothetical protein